MLQHTKGDPSERRPLDKYQGVVGSGQGKEGESKKWGRGLKRSGEWEKRAGLGPSGVGSEDGRLQFNWSSVRIQLHSRASMNVRAGPTLADDQNGMP
jgi:hypothetical protein